MSYVSSFDPVLPARPKVLILGSMPGMESLRQTQYYAHPRNAFWPIIGELISLDSELAYTRRIAALKRAGIALWDVFQQCERSGSLDSAIKTHNATLNDISGLLNKKPTITAIFLNGGKAAAAFRRYVANTLATSVHVVELPSTSPANARMTVEEKQQAWQCIAEYL